MSVENTDRSLERLRLRMQDFADRGLLRQPPASPAAVRFHPSIALLRATAHGGETPLHVEARWGRDSKAIELISAGADLTAIDDEGETPLHAAVDGGHASTVQLLLDAGADPCEHVGSWPKLSPLQQAATRGDTVVVGMLVKALKKAGVGLDATNELGETALHAAARFGHPDIVLLLLSMGASANAVSEHGDTPLHLAASHGAVAVVQALLDAEAGTATAGADTALHSAATYSHAAQSIKGAEVDAVNSRRMTPLHEAARAGHAAAVTVLLNAGAAVNVTTQPMLHTALHLAARVKQPATLQALVDAGAACRLKMSGATQPYTQPLTAAAVHA